MKFNGSDYTYGDLCVGGGGEWGLHKKPKQKETSSSTKSSVVVG